MEQYKRDFIEFVLETKALKFGEFTLKSGRKSPFFFNAGSFYSGENLAKLSSFYASAIKDKFPNFDILFGPSYKGIPLSVGTTLSLFKNFNINVDYATNRKEAKDHGEKGVILGKQLFKDAKVILIDDVVTSGISVEESISLINDIEKVNILGLIVSINRQEKSISSDNSALKELEIKHNFKAESIVTMKEVITYLKETHREIMTDKLLKSIVDYYHTYGASDSYKG